MKKLFISQPMTGLTDVEILETRRYTKEQAKNIIGEKLELIDSYFTEHPAEIEKGIPIWYLGKAIQMMSDADIVCFADGWEYSKGCIVEYDVASLHKIPIVFVNDNNY